MSAGPGRAMRGTPRSRSTAASDGSATPAGNDTSRRGKFNANGERVNGIWMASEAEAERYRQLLRMEMDGKIGNLKTQITYPLVVNNVLICRYRADFSYDVLDPTTFVATRHVIEDVKGFETPDFKLKHKLFDALVDTKLSVIPAKGKAKHPDHPLKPSSRAGWMHRHWNDRIPD